MTVKAKLLFGLILVPVGLLAASHLVHRESFEERFVLPTGYQGPFIAIYDQARAASPRQSGTAAVYQVPASGVIRIASPEPPFGTRVTHSFGSDSAEILTSFRTCVDLFLYVTDSRPYLCWLDYQVLGTGIPDHIVAVVTDWSTIEANFDRTTAVYDSILFDGRAIGSRKWKDQKPSEPPKMQAAATSGTKPL